MLKQLTWYIHIYIYDASLGDERQQAASSHHFVTNTAQTLKRSHLSVSHCYTTGTTLHSTQGLPYALPSDFHKFHFLHRPQHACAVHRGRFSGRNTRAENDAFAHAFSLSRNRCGRLQDRFGKRKKQCGNTSFPARVFTLDMPPLSPAAFNATAPDSEKPFELGAIVVRSEKTHVASVR